MFHSFHIILVALCVSVLPYGEGAVAKENKAVAKKPEGDVKLLFVTQSAGYQHDVVARKSKRLSLAERAMTELGAESGLFHIDCTQDVAKDFTKKRLDGYDIVMFYSTGDLPIAKDVLDYFLNDWLKQPGHGCIGVHPATDTYKEHKPYWDMIGGTFIGHPWNANSNVTITVHDTEHPLCRPWGKEFSITDEIYIQKHWQPEKVRVLMSLNMEKTSLKKPYHVPIAWCKEYGKGRVFYMSLGHRPDVWTNPTYMKSIQGGIEWIIGLAEGDATPNPEVSAEQDRLAKAAAKGEGK